MWHVIEFFTDFGDILKLTLVKARDMDKIAYAKCIVQSLRIAYDNAKVILIGSIVLS